MQTETNIDLMSRDDGDQLGMGRLSVRDDNTPKKGIKNRMSGKRMSKMQNGAGACNSCE